MPSRRGRAHRSFALGTAGVILALVVVVGNAPSAWAEKGKCEGAIFLDPVCEVGKTVVGAAGGVVTAPFRYAASSAVDMITNAVAEAATWLLGKVVGFIDHSTSPDLSAGWFRERYGFMVGLGALILLPMLLFAAIRAIIQQDLSQLIRSFAVHLPVAILGTFLAMYLTQALLVATDGLSDAVAKGIAGDTSEIFDSVGNVLSAPVGVSGGAAIPAFALLVGAFLLIVGSFLVWLELLVRSAAVTVSAFFLPLMLAGLVWPATAHWTKRLVQTLVALILSKFVIVSVISLATAALSDPGGGGFGTIMGASALMLMAAFSPIALLKLMPLAEGAALGHLEGMGRRPLAAVGPGGGANHAISIMRSKVSGSSQGSQLAVAGSRTGAAGGATGAKAAIGAAGAAASRGVKAGKAAGKRMENQHDASAPKTSPPSGAKGGGLGDASPRPSPRRDGPGKSRGGDK